MVQPVNIQSGRLLMQTGPAATETETRAPTATRRDTAGDTVVLGGAQSLPAALGAGPPKDTARIDSLRHEIAEGRYRPDPDRIADSLAQNIIELSS